MVFTSSSSCLLASGSCSQRALLGDRWLDGVLHQLSRSPAGAEQLLARERDPSRRKLILVATRSTTMMMDANSWFWRLVISDGGHNGGDAGRLRARGHAM